MKAIGRLEKYSDYDLDVVLLRIRNGSIKSGRYSHLVKIDKDMKIGKEFEYNAEDKGK